MVAPYCQVQYTRANGLHELTQMIAFHHVACKSNLKISDGDSQIECHPLTLLAVPKHLRNSTHETHSSVVCASPHGRAESILGRVMRPYCGVKPRHLARRQHHTSPALRWVSTSSYRLRHEHPPCTLEPSLYATCAAALSANRDCGIPRHFGSPFYSCTRKSCRLTRSHEKA